MPFISENQQALENLIVDCCGQWAEELAAMGAVPLIGLSSCTRDGKVRLNIRWFGPEKDLDLMETVLLDALERLCQGERVHVTHEQLISGEKR